ncbi:MAG: hypothetical protein QN157_00795 [Armatimonadota bacterium]|nr:hypothetical protein [Armatimonadota bacterium]
MTFSLERDRFRQFRQRFAGQVRTATELAIRQIYEEYDTGLRENRFVVGGVVELIVGCALRACGIPVRHRGLMQTELDLRFEDTDGGYSVKALFKSPTTNLVNVLGQSPSLDRWRTATLFVVGDIGIVYSDPSLPWWVANLERCVRVTSGALTIRRRCLGEFAREAPTWVAGCTVPGVRAPGALRPLRAASTDVASQILMHHQVLFTHFPALGPGQQT